MTLDQFSDDIRSTISRHGYADVSVFVITDVFAQPERRTSLGDAAASFCGLPTERETFRRWLRANGWMDQINITSPCDVRIIPLREGE